MKEYLISQVEVADPEAFARYRELAAAAIEKFGGRYLVQGAVPQVVEGDWAPPNADRQQIVVVEFPSHQAVEDWYASPEYAQALAHRETALHRRLFHVEGTD